jgi:N6-L-threonylcarbamoyladenine synthase
MIKNTSKSNTKNLILSIESSCDDSSIAITNIENKKLIYHKKISQEIDHSKYGGVVPELAARLHATALPNILQECEVYFDDLVAIAVTTEPGLSVTLQEGIMMAKALSISLEIPLIEVNHLLGHIYSLFIDKDIKFPMMVLLVSGGHTQLIDISEDNIMNIIASTSDDSFGESFDKVSKMLNLGYPGGPVIEKYAKDGDKDRYDFPIALRNNARLEFSYSGLKNAVRLQIEQEKQNGTLQANIPHICASFQKIATAHILLKVKQYFKKLKKEQKPYPKDFAIVGGASANLYLRGEFEKFLKEYNCSLSLSELEFCSDNSAMIGRYAVEKFEIEKYIENKASH